MGSAAAPLGYVNRIGTEQQEQLSVEVARELVARNELQALDTATDPSSPVEPGAERL